jgi:hypothetical protein
MHTRLLVLAALLLMLGMPLLMPRRVTAQSPPATIQLASDEEGGRDEDELPPLRRGSRSTASHALKGTKQSSGGYDPKRIKRFWSLYHGARPESKHSGGHSRTKGKLYDDRR